MGRIKTFNLSLQERKALEIGFRLGSSHCFRTRCQGCAAVAHEVSRDVPVNLHAHQIRHAKTLATLEDENRKNIPKKWKSQSNNLAAFLSIKGINGK